MTRSPPQSATSSAALVEVRNLSVTITGESGPVTIVDDVSFSVRRGRVLCLLGESGSGKSMTMKAMMRLMPRNAAITGSVKVGGSHITSLSPAELRRTRGSLIAMIFQEPMTALDPVFTIGQQIVETVRRHEGSTDRMARKRALELLDLVQIPSAHARIDAYPHELSGGLRQRAMIALALSCRPELLLADEPTTALDATVQIQILLLLRRLQEELGMSMILVTHDLGVACEVADDVAVMYAGRFVETGSIESVSTNPTHPYTRGLMRSVVHGARRGSELHTIPGAPPSLGDLPQGCSFVPRCSDFLPDLCLKPQQLRASGPNQAARCIRADELAPAALA